MMHENIWAEEEAHDRMSHNCRKDVPFCGFKDVCDVEDDEGEEGKGEFEEGEGAEVEEGSEAGIGEAVEFVVEAGDEGWFEDC